MHITMIGTGYVGLVTGACFAEMGLQVTCMDIDAAKISKLKDEGQLPIYEPGLAELVHKNQAAGRLHFTTDLASCVPQSDAVFIAVGTPQDEDGSADMQYVLAAARNIAPLLQDYTVVVNKSTVPVGTAVQVTNEIRQVNPAADFDVVSNPEFLREGFAVYDFMEAPDRVVIGVASERARDVMRQLYASQTERGVPLLECNPESSEIIKYASNAFLAVKITYINQIAQLCDAVGADVQAVAQGMGLDSRIGPRFLQPGPGFGGSCFPKDNHAITNTARQNDVNLSLVEETIQANQRIKESMVDRILAACDQNIQGKKIAVLGLAFKAGTDDMRDAAALTILPRLVEKGAQVMATDPEAMARAQELMPQLTYDADMWACVQDADAVVILTEWADYKEMSLQKVAQLAKSPVLIDFRNLFEPAVAEAAGLFYHPLGRGVKSAAMTKAA